jgi:uncharacterized membrane protein
MYEILKFLHVLAMFTATTIFVGNGYLLAVICRSRDVVAIRQSVKASLKLNPVGGAAVTIGVILGFITALNGNLDLTQTWLILGYVLTAGVFAMGLGYWTPKSKALLEAAEASPVEEPTAELSQRLVRLGNPVILVFDTLLWASIIFVMVTKPFS